MPIMKEITEKINLAFTDILYEPEADRNVVVVRAPRHSLPDMIYDDCRGRKQTMGYQQHKASVRCGRLYEIR